MRRWVELARFIGVGWYIAASILFGLIIGIWLDSFLGTRLLFTLVGLILGLVLAFYGVYRMLQSFLNSDKKGDKGDR